MCVVPADGWGGNAHWIKRAECDWRHVVAGAPRLVDGQLWGPYRVIRLLGRGGMGEVYEAEQLETGRRLALKVLRHTLGGADDRARFLREGQSAASISHAQMV